MEYELNDSDIHSVWEDSETRWLGLGFDEVDVLPSSPRVSTGAVDPSFMNSVESSNSYYFQTPYNGQYNNAHLDITDSVGPEHELLPISHSDSRPPSPTFAQSYNHNYQASNDGNNNYEINNSYLHTPVATAYNIPPLVPTPRRVDLTLHLQHHPEVNITSKYMVVAIQSDAGPWVMDPRTLGRALEDFLSVDSRSLSLSKCSRVQRKYRIRDCFRTNQGSSLTDLQNVYQNKHLKCDTYLLDVDEGHVYMKAVQDNWKQNWKIPECRQLLLRFTSE